ncbi:unnamed protein product [Durusdinium trenchii]|uniref:Uncharacterized protein n=2 Tax=Durusdinium trenchii TaxID=1381693 RepID=A0ABP0K5E3_9DINO
MVLRLLAFSLALVGADLLLDDECREGSCALNALQRRTSGLREEDEEGVFAFEPFVTEAEAKETQNVSVEDLGTDELQRLVGMAQAELRKRGSDSELGTELGAGPEASDTIGHQEGMASNGTEDALTGRLDRSASYAGSDAAGCGYSKYYGNSPKELCFCKLAGNSGCASKKCTCPQGCGRNVVWESSESVTFKNRARANGCHPSTVLLTAPKAYYGTPADLKKCGNAVSVIEMLLRDSWNMYQSRVSRGSMNQCFHGSHTASVKYLHLQSFCSYASFHAMPNNNHAVGVCVKMRNINEASSLARKLYSQMQ